MVLKPSYVQKEFQLRNAWFNEMNLIVAVYQELSLECETKKGLVTRTQCENAFASTSV